MAILQQKLEISKMFITLLVAAGLLTAVIVAFVLLFFVGLQVEGGTWDDRKEMYVHHD